MRRLYHGSADITARVASRLGVDGAGGGGGGVVGRWSCQGAETMARAASRLGLISVFSQAVTTMVLQYMYWYGKFHTIVILE